MKDPPSAGGCGCARVRGFLAVAQLALSSALLFTAGLLVHRTLEIRFADVGFDTSPLVTLEVLAPRTFTEGQLDAARRQVAERLQALPEVAAVSELTSRPFGSMRMRALVPATDASAARAVDVLQSRVPANYFATVQLPLVRGRYFAPHETSNDRVVVISETAARTFWPEQDALGQHFELPERILRGDDAAAAGSADDANSSRPSATVIGIVPDTRVYDPQAGDGISSRRPSCSFVSVTTRGRLSPR